VINRRAWSTTNALKLSTFFGGENRHRQHREYPAGALIVGPFKTEITGHAIAYE